MSLGVLFWHALYSNTNDDNADTCIICRNSL